MMAAALTFARSLQHLSCLMVKQLPVHFINEPLIWVQPDWNYDNQPSQETETRGSTAASRGCKRLRLNPTHHHLLTLNKLVLTGHGCELKCFKLYKCCSISIIRESRGSYGEAAGSLAPYSSSCAREARRVSGLLETEALVWNQLMYPECTAHSEIKDVCIFNIRTGRWEQKPTSWYSRGSF